ncbi:alpha/beta hydrolase [Flammeovirgaceae bacterium SG7u.111]|nr:alpha/beta hydrolase [Flammeovirgaceae bacterium SG7u.132]WPO36640.1 alpha/beta hydrolase [Flammeovirgaceae bacterium SG7u.111]
MKMKCILYLLLGALLTACSTSKEKRQDQIEEKKKWKTFSSFDNTTIALTDEGKGSPVMLLHGFISNGSSWNNAALKQELLNAGYRVIVPDLRGNGNSDKPHTPEAYANNAETKDLLALADHLQLETYTAIGYSRGSIVLAKLLTQEKRIKKAVIGGMGLDFTNPDWDRRIMFAEAFGGEAPLSDITREAVEYATSIGADLKVLSLLQHHQPVTSITELKAIETPTLIIAGDLDKDNGDPAELQQYLPNSQLAIVPGDHNNTYKGEEFAKKVLKFLE